MADISSDGNRVSDLIFTFALRPKSADPSTEPLPPAPWQVKDFRLQEALSTPYVATFTLTNDARFPFDPRAFFDADCTFEILDGSPLADREVLLRLFGSVRDVDFVGVRHDRLLVRITVVPGVEELGYGRRFRIFQKQTVPQILQTILDERLGPLKRTAVLDLTRKDHVEREYTVQYGESDLAFIQRLMEDEGISYHFIHEDENENEVIVLTDDNARFPNNLEPGDADGNIPVDPDGVGFVGRINGVRFVRQRRTTHGFVQTFDWTQPALPLTFDLEGADLHGADREIFDYPVGGLSTAYDQDKLRYQQDPAQYRRHGTRLVEADRVSAQRVLGQSQVVRFRAGQSFGLAADRQKYLLTEVLHEGVELAASDDLSTAADNRPVYRNSFVAVPFAVPFRPARVTPRPRVFEDTAIVVGPPDEEIFTDEHGRVKVQFHWDRDGKRNDQSSCFVRVAQGWAGPAFGIMFIPRIGMEVVVSFLGGDPDRPLIVSGGVYNGNNPTPYVLPGDKTKSTIKTNTSPGGAGFNELRFEDLKGKEEIFIKAQKDMNEVVQHDHSTKVTRNQSNSVGGSHSESVGGEQSLTVTGNRTATIKGDENITVKGGGGKGASLTVTGDYVVDASKNVSVTAPDSITIKCKNTVIRLTPTDIFLETGLGAGIHLNNFIDIVSSLGAQARLDSNFYAAAKEGADLFLGDHVRTASPGGSRVLLNADALMEGGTKATVVSTETTVKGDSKATVTASATMELSSSGAAINGGSGIVDVKGSTITMNS